MNTVKHKKPTINISFASKIDLVWSYLSQNMGLFQPSANTNQKKRKSSLEAREMKLEG
jgi:hypothetical protein